MGNGSSDTDSIVNRYHLFGESFLYRIPERELLRKPVNRIGFHEAGGKVTTPEGKPFLYGKPGFLNGSFVAYGQ